MKNHPILRQCIIYSFEYIVIFILFVLPPFFAVTKVQLDLPQFTVSSLLLYVTAISICGSVRYRYDLFSQTVFVKPELSIKQKTVYGIITLLCISVAACVCNMFAPQVSVFSVDFPTGSELFFLLCGTILAAVYEEVLYRLYLPDFLYGLTVIILRNKTMPYFRILYWCGEFVCVMIFAFSHWQNGLIAVINAACAGIILRIVFCYSGSLLPGIFSHVIYNLGIYVILLL